MYVYVHVYIYVYIICICVYRYVQVGASKYVGTRVGWKVQVCVHVQRYLYARVHVHANMHTSQKHCECVLPARMPKHVFVCVDM